MAWNGFPDNIRKSTVRKLKVKHNINGLPSDNPMRLTNVVDDISGDDTPKIWFRIPYLGRQGEHLIKKVIRKIPCSHNKRAKFVVIYRKTKKVRTSYRKRTEFLNLIAVTSSTNFLVRLFSIIRRENNTNPTFLTL